MNQLQGVSKKAWNQNCVPSLTYYMNTKNIIILLSLGQNGHNIFVFHISFRSFYKSKYFVKLLCKCKDKSCMEKSIPLSHKVLWLRDGVWWGGGGSLGLRAFLPLLSSGAFDNMLLSHVERLLFAWLNFEVTGITILQSLSFSPNSLESFEPRSESAKSLLIFFHCAFWSNTTVWF